MKVIWATDGSENADAALPFARRLAATDDGSLIAVHCNEILAGRAPGFPFVPEEAELEERVRRQVEELCADGCDAKLVVLRGPVAEAAFMIADLAAETGAEVIVVGTRGRGPLAGAIGGSVTQQLLHAAPCPVAAVPGSRARGTKGKRRGWIVHA
jgi:nucleotide-binding universal stress UspA family protein